MLNLGRIIMRSNYKVQIQCSEGIVIQWWQPRTCCQFIQDQTGSLNSSAILYILKRTKLRARQDKKEEKTQDGRFLSLPLFKHPVWTSALCNDAGKSVIRAFWCNIPDIFPPVSCWGYGSCDSVLLSSLRNVEKNNWIKIDWQDL